MHDAVPDGDDLLGADFGKHLLQGLLVGQPADADVLDEPRSPRCREIAVARKQRILDRRRAGVEGEDELAQT
jgi:hypothetical protein